MRETLEIREKMKVTDHTQKGTNTHTHTHTHNAHNAHTYQVTNSGTEDTLAVDTLHTLYCTHFTTTHTLLQTLYYTHTSR